MVCGVAGVSGYNAFQQLRKKYGDTVYGQRPIKNWPLVGDGIIGADLEDPVAFKKLLKDHKIKSLLNCGGTCALKACELDPFVWFIFLSIWSIREPAMVDIWKPTLRTL